MKQALKINKGVDGHLKKVVDESGLPTAMDISEDSVRVKNLEVTGNTIGVTATDDTKHPLTTVGIATNNLVKCEETCEEDDFAIFGPDGLKGLTATEAKTDLSLNNVTNESKATMFTNPSFTGNLTVEDGFTIDSAGSISLDSHDGNFIAKKAGTEFSVANSAYAGMILGYRCIGESTVHGSYTLTTSFAVVDSAMTIRFVAPPSGNVEIMIQIYANAGTSNRFLYFALSDNSTFNSIGGTYEQLHRMPDETDDTLVQHYWTVTGLTAGNTYNYWLGARTNATNSYLGWGGTTTARFGDFIMKATALPAATSNFAEYG